MQGETIGFASIRWFRKYRGIMPESLAGWHPARAT